MFLIYWCLLALTSSGFSFPQELPWESNHVRSLSARANQYGASAGFKPANIKDYPYMASLSYQRAKSPLGAGAIINENWIVTTAYFAQVPPPQINVFVGTNFAGRSGQRFNVTKIITHPKYSQDYQSWYNIALFKTEKPITFNDNVQPAKLAKAVPKVGTNCTLLGYGLLHETPYTGYDFGAAAVKIRPNGPCEINYGALKTSFCAGARDVEVCLGDISDILVHNGELVGFFVNGDYCFSEYFPSTIFTKVPVFRKWIWKTIKDNSNENEIKGLSEDQFE